MNVCAVDNGDLGYKGASDAVIISLVIKASVVLLMRWWWWRVELTLIISQGSEIISSLLIDGYIFALLKWISASIYYITRLFFFLVFSCCFLQCQNDYLECFQVFCLFLYICSSWLRVDVLTLFFNFKASTLILEGIWVFGITSELPLTEV